MIAESGRFDGSMRLSGWVSTRRSAYSEAASAGAPHACRTGRSASAWALFAQSSVSNTVSVAKTQVGPHDAKPAFEERNREERSAVGRWSFCAHPADAAHTRVCGDEIVAIDGNASGAMRINL
jgi:hypothetical protein